MIAKLKGLVDSSGDDWVVLDVNGVGYLVFCSARTLSRLPAAGEAAALVVETHVREDHIHLYGFISEAERSFFRLLLTVQGVGAKVALALLSVGDITQLSQAIAAQDKATLSRAAGVGPKLAARIASELKDKVSSLSLGAPVAGVVMTAPREAIAEPSVLEDAVSALVNLGYARLDAFAAVGRAAAALGQGAAVSALIGAALRDLGKGA